MTDYIQPLNLESWIITIFSGSADIFSAIAILVIFGLAGYFRMPLLATFLFMGIFLLMFTSWISSPLLILIAVFGGLSIGYTISKIFG